MAETTFMGVRRNLIPWAPTIDYAKCDFCMECDQFCPHGVFQRQEEDPSTRLVVANPNHCVVFCRACAKTCGPDALSFPDKTETTKLIKESTGKGGKSVSEASASERYAYLPCNGLDKPEGALSRELALLLVEAAGGELICPVLLGRSQARYVRMLGELPVFAIDGCATRCASRLAADRGITVARKLQIAEALKAAGASVEQTLTPGPVGLAFVRKLVAGLLVVRPPITSTEAAADFAAPVSYLTLSHDKFIFRVPAEGFFFNENDCWARVSGNRARVGITDFMQQTLTDILFCTPAAAGSEVEQFGEAGTVESSKAAFEVVSPVAGRVVAVNPLVMEAPELVNEDPYERGWLVELELADLASDRELLLDGPQYLAHLKQKAADYRV